MAVSKIKWQEVKPIWKSKTFWFNVLVIVAGVSSYLVGSVEQGATITAIGVVNAVLRTVTSSEVTLR